MERERKKLQETLQIIRNIFRKKSKNIIHEMKFYDEKIIKKKEAGVEFSESKRKKIIILL